MLIPLLVFLAVSALLAGLYMWLVPTRTGQRLQALSVEAGESQWRQTAVRLAAPLARLSAPVSDWDSSPLRVQFFNAGIRHDNARLVYYAAKTVLPLALAAAAYMALTLFSQVTGQKLLFFVASAALVGVYLPNAVLWWLVNERQREIFETFPDAADLMLVCVEAGLGLDAGLARVAEEIRLKSQALADELHLTLLEIRAGGTREKSLRNLAARTGVEELGTFAIMLTQADKFGASIGESMRVFSDDLRHKRQMRAEESAAKVPTKMLLPLVLFIFPSIIMVIMGPAAIQIIRNLLPMLGGQT
ncbi:MAG: Type secretion system protein TadC [Pseudomonadota bacterium]|jgi:tight adherence protein C